MVSHCVLEFEYQYQGACLLDPNHERPRAGKSAVTANSEVITGTREEKWEREKQSGVGRSTGVRGQNYSGFSMPSSSGSTLLVV